MKRLTILLLLICAQNSFAQIKTITLNKQELPKFIHYTGNIINAAKYTDVDGEHIMITTDTSYTVVISGDSSYSKAEVYAYNYIIKGHQLLLLWQTHDFSIVCPVDTRAEYVPNTFAITDLNKDGKAEVWLMYVIACRGDVSPASMKIIMHEGSKKYAVRGSSRVQSLPKKYDGGEYTLDESFKTGPNVFQQYATQLWKKNLIEKGD